MTTSGIELRKSLGYRNGAKPGPQAPAPRPGPARTTPLSTAARIAAPPRVPAQPAEPGTLAIGWALAIVLAERFAARIARPVSAERHLWADYAKGLGLALALTVQFCWIAAQDGATPFRSLYLMLNPMALPAFMVACGLFAERALNQRWIDYLPGRIWPYFVALACWAAAQIVATWIAAPRGAMSFAMAWRALGTATEFAPLLLIVPAYLLIVRHMRNHFWFLAALAVLAELLVIPGRTFGGEMMRGLVYFVAGVAFSTRLRMLADEAKKDFRMTIGAVAIFIALVALCVFIRMPYAGGATIATLPFASLALGFAGAFCLIMVSSLLAEFRLFESLAALGRNWTIWAVVAPLGLGASRALLIATHAVPNTIAADIVLGVAALAAMAAGLGLTLIQRLGHEAPRQAPQDSVLPISLR